MVNYSTRIMCKSYTSCIQMSPLFCANLSSRTYQEISSFSQSSLIASHVLLRQPMAQYGRRSFSVAASITSGVTLLRGCPWARDGWVPHWLRNGCAKCKKSKRATRASLVAWGLGARLRAPVGSRGKDPGGGLGGEAPWSSCAFQCGYSISNANLYTSDR